MRLSEYFEKFYVNQSVFAKKVGISRTALNNYAKGTIPRLDRAYKIQELTNGLVTISLDDWVVDKKVSGKKTKKKTAKKN